MQKIRDRLDKHRNESIICCEETCWCWDVESLLTEIEKMEADHKKEISSLEAQVKEKDEQIEATIFSGTLGEIIKTQKEQIAALTKERDKLRDITEMLINFIPDGWSMPLGYTQVVAQAREALAAQLEVEI